MKSIDKRKTSAKRSIPVDTRKQLFNEGKVGAIKKIQLSTEQIAQLNGILLDLDPGLLRKGSLIASISKTPDTLYEKTVKHWLARHPVLDKAEVRMSGTGLHVIPWFEHPVLFEEDGDRERWCAIVQVVQSVLPTDPHAPGITATTRALGSVNSKCGKKVRRLKKGTRVSTDEILQLHEQMCSAPFKTVVELLTGTDRVTPCPFCDSTEQSLKALDYVGMCYECGKVPFIQLGQLLFREDAKAGGKKQNGRKPK